MPTPLHSLLPVHKSRSATMVTAPPVHPAQTSAQPLIDNVRHKRGAEPDQGNVQPGLLSQRDGIAASETTPKYRRTTEENAAQTADDRPRFDDVQDRPVFFPVSPEWFHLGSQCAPIARQVEPIIRPAGTYLGPFNGGTQTDGTRRATETIIRAIRTSSAETLRADTDHTAAKQIINENIRRGTIERVDSISAWCSPMSFVRIPNGNIRSVVDLVRLNMYITRPIHQSVESQRDDPNTRHVYRQHADGITQQNDPGATHMRTHRTNNTCHVVHKQEAHTTGRPTGLIPDRGKN